MSNIIKLYPENAAKDPDNVLEQAIGEYNDVLILGFDKDNMMDCRTNLGMEVRDMLFLIDKFKHKLLAGEYDDEE